MKKIFGLILLYAVSVPALAQEIIEKYNIFVQTIELEANDHQIELEDFRVKKVPTLVKVKSLPYCDGVETCRSYEILEEKPVLQLSYRYSTELPYYAEEVRTYQFVINFPLETISADQRDELRSLGQGLGTPKKYRKRIELARRLFREETKEVFVKVLGIDYERSIMCSPDELYCVEDLKYVQRLVKKKHFSVFLK
jgi:hypothetical protein